LNGYGFLSGGKSYRGVKFCRRDGLLSAQVFSRATVATTDMGRKEGSCCNPFSGELGPPVPV